MFYMYHMSVNTPSNSRWIKHREFENTLVDRLSLTAGIMKSSLIDDENDEVIVRRPSLVDGKNGEVIVRRSSLVNGGNGIVIAGKLSKEEASVLEGEG